jgi:hypothetical protein
MVSIRCKIFGLMLLASAMPGCVERTLSIQTNPPGALVRLNGGPQELRTPARHDFVWYGTYDIVIRKEGYQTIKTKAPVIAPIYEWIPLDLISELLPFHIKDSRTLKYELTPQPTQEEDADALLQRSKDLRAQLPDPKKAAQ